MIEEARTLLARAKDDYQRALKAVDVHLLAAVRADVKHIKAASALQATYDRGFEATPLTLLSQPSAPKSAKPRSRTRTRKAAKRR